jgi:hypothetical protein
LESECSEDCAKLKSDTYRWSYRKRGMLPPRLCCECLAGMVWRSNAHRHWNGYHFRLGHLLRGVLYDIWPWDKRRETRNRQREKGLTHGLVTVLDYNPVMYRSIHNSGCWIHNCHWGWA